MEWGGGAIGMMMFKECIVRSLSVVATLSSVIVGRIVKIISHSMIVVSRRGGFGVAMTVRPKA
jgi:hypothetical protein